MTDTKDLVGIDEIITRLCRIEQGVDELRLATHQIFVALAQADPNATINREDLETIGEALLKKFGYPAIQSLYKEAGLKTTTAAPTKTQTQIAAYLALQKTQGNPTAFLKGLIVNEDPKSKRNERLPGQTK